MTTTELYIDVPMYGYKEMFNGNIMLNRTIDKVQDSMQRAESGINNQKFLDEHSKRREMISDINKVELPSNSRTIGGANNKPRGKIFNIKIKPSARRGFRSSYF